MTSVVQTPSTVVTAKPKTDTLEPEQGDLFQRAQLSIQQLLKSTAQFSLPLQTALQNELGLLSGLHLKLQQGLLQIATFGFVSRGKSAVLNALFSEPIFPVGPLNGETQWPRSVRWSLGIGGHSSGFDLQIELIDTPGLDEIEGQARAQMTQEIAHTADLILFIVAGPPTSLELAALKDLRQAGRPLLLIVNKADLYPDLDAAQIYERLDDPALQQVLSPQEILLTSAAPAPVEIRVEWPDGRTSTDWEAPPADIESLRSRLLQLLNQEGRTLLTLNTLLQAHTVVGKIADQVQAEQSQAAQACLDRYAGLKATFMALCPWALIDLGMAVLADLLLIGALVKLYRLPTHRYQVNRLWGKLFFSLLSLLLVEVGGQGVLDLIHSGWMPWLGAGILQAGAGWYGATEIGKQTQAYLLKGWTWGPLGVSAIATEILDQLQPPMLLYRLRPELWENLS
jgi:GTPase SAR1 family protein